MFIYKIYIEIVQKSERISPWFVCSYNGTCSKHFARYLVYVPLEMLREVRNEINVHIESVSVLTFYL
jgi:hypothetical protein